MSLQTHRKDRSRRRAIVMAAVACCGVTCINRPAGAQNWISPSSGSWSDPLNWNSLPVPGSTTLLNFAPTGTQTFTATDDFPGAFALNNLTIGGSSTGSVTIAAGSVSMLNFTGVGPTIQSSSPGGVVINGLASFGPSLYISNSGSAGSIVINSPLNGSGPVVIFGSSPNAIVLGSANTIGGGVNMSGVRVEFGSQDAFGAATLSANGGLLATSLNVIPSGNAPNRPILRNAIFPTGSGFVFGGNYGFTIAGTINAGNNVTFNPTNALDATWALTGTNSLSGQLIVNGSSTPGVTSTLLLPDPSALGSASSISINGNGAQLLFGAGSSTVTINQPISVGTLGGQLGAFAGGTLARVNFTGNITGSGSLNIAGNGLVGLAGTNTFSGPLILSGGIATALTDANLGGGTSISLVGGSLMLDPAFGTTSRAVAVGTIGSTIYIPAGATATFTGNFSNTPPADYSKAGGGTLVETASNSFNGRVNINGGALVVSGVNGQINSGTGQISVADGATFVVDSTASNRSRIGNSTLSLAGGDFRFIGNTAASGSINSGGTLNLGTLNDSGAGYIVVQVDGVTGFNSSVRFNRINRTANNGTVIRFIGPGMGQGTLASFVANTTNVGFTSSPAGLQVNGILPWAVVDSGGGSVDFAAYSTSNGMIRYSAYAGNLTSGSLSNASITSAGLGSTTVAVSSLKLNGGTIDLSFNTTFNGTLAVNSGGILVVGASTINSSLAGTPTLQIGIDATSTTNAPTGYFITDADLQVNAKITSFDGGLLVSGIAKAGTANMTLGAVNTYVGNTRVLAGTLRQTVANAVPATSEVVVAPGATFDINGLPATIGSLNQTGPLSLIGDEAIGTVLLGGTTLITGGDNNSTAVNLNIVGTGTITKNGTGTMTVAGSQSFSGTINVNNGALLLGTHLNAGTGFSGTARINIGIGTNATSGDPSLIFGPGLRDGFAVPLVTNVVAGRTATLKFLTTGQGSPGVTFNSPINMSTATGLTIDASGGMTIAGTIIGSGALTTASSDGFLAGGSDSFALNITGANNYTGATTLTAISTLFGNASAFGNTTATINLGSSTGDDTPELSSSVGGLTLSRNINVASSTNVVPTVAYLGSRAPAGSGTTTYSGLINIVSSRSRLVLFSDNDPISMTNTISGGTFANVQIGRSYGLGMEANRSAVYMMNQNTYPAGTRLLTGTLGFGTNSFGAFNAPSSGPVGTGTLTIGTNETPAGLGPTLVAVGGNRTIGNALVINSNFTLAGTNAMTFTNGANLGSGPRVITVNNSSTLTLSGTLSGSAGVALIKNGGGYLTLNGASTFAGPMVAAGGALILNATQHLGGVIGVGGGAATSLAASGGANLIVAPAVAVTTGPSGGWLDLADNALIVDYSGSSPINSIQAMLASGRGSGSWNGTGIMSSTVASGATQAALGMAEASALGISNFRGEPVDSTAVIVAYTVAGDANLDGIVDVKDFQQLALSFGLSGRFWSQGDFNYDGIVNSVDLGVMARNWQVSLGTFAASAAPEPASLAGIFVGAGMILRRRRRHG